MSSRCGGWGFPSRVRCAYNLPESIPACRQGVRAVYTGPVRKPLRYRGHDYRAPCTVHVTICTHHRQALFGAVSGSGVELNGAGRFVAESLRRIVSPARGIIIDTHIVMPDHVHAIIVLGTNPGLTTTESIPEIVHGFKIRVQKSWPRGVRHGDWDSYDTHLWQRSYYDTLIRNARHLETTRAYILDNPRRWIDRLESGSRDRDHSQQL
jgi:REP element-mobilizing transposase RayT